MVLDMTENKPYIKAMRELRRSNAAQPHEDKRLKRSKSRKQALLKHLKETQ